MSSSYDPEGYLATRAAFGCPPTFSGTSALHRGAPGPGSGSPPRQPFGARDRGGVANTNATDPSAARAARAVKPQR